MNQLASPLAVPPASPRSGVPQSRHLFRSIAVYLVVPNLIFAALDRLMFVSRPLINIDYLLLGAVADFLPVSLTVFGYTFLLMDDVLVTFAPVFHFSLENAVFALRYGFRLQGSILVLPGLVALAAAALAFLGVRASSSAGRRSARPVLLGMALAVFVVDVVGGTNRFARRDTALLPINTAVSTLYKTATAVYSGIVAGRGGVRPEPMPAAMDAARAAVDDHRRGGSDVLLVLVESLGSSLEVIADSQVLAPLLSDDIRRRYDIRSGTVLTHGSTTNAEFRELCGFDADYRWIERIDTGSCLPARLRARGFRTIAIHGYTGGLFDRYRWYPRLGFDEIWFAEQLLSSTGARFCGRAFRGLCDADVARVVERKIIDAPPGQRRFVYWLTLNSHLPVDPGGGVGSSFDCTRTEETRHFDDVCTLLRTQSLVASAVAALAMDPHLPHTRIIIVGDHAPPFFSRVTRSLFLANQVPFLELVPKEGGPAESRARH